MHLCRINLGQLDKSCTLHIQEGFEIGIVQAWFISIKRLVKKAKKCVQETYASRKKPASERHLTVASFGKIPRKSSQCTSVASPPAEQPERRTCSVINRSVKPTDPDNSWVKAKHIS